MPRKPYNHGRDDGYNEFQAGMAAYFRNPAGAEGMLPTVRDTAAYYRERNIAAVIFPVDAERETGFHRYSNEDVAQLCAENDDTLMRKDGEEHRSERMAMAPAFAPRVITTEWVPRYQQIAEEYVARLPRDEMVDLFHLLSGAYADRGDRANEAIHGLLDRLQDRHRPEPNSSASSVMLNADDPIPETQIYANIKIAIGGGINEPRDALNTTLCGLLTIHASANRDEEVVRIPIS